MNCAVHLWSMEDDWDIQTEGKRFAPRVAEGLPEMLLPPSSPPGLSSHPPGAVTTHPIGTPATKEQNVELADQLNRAARRQYGSARPVEVWAACAAGMSPGADPAKYEEDYRPQMGGDDP